MTHPAPASQARCWTQGSLLLQGRACAESCGAYPARGEGSVMLRATAGSRGRQGPVDVRSCAGLGLTLEPPPTPWPPSPTVPMVSLILPSSCHQVDPGFWGVWMGQAGVLGSDPGSRADDGVEHQSHGPSCGCPRSPHGSWLPSPAGLGGPFLTAGQPRGHCLLQNLSWDPRFSLLY